MAGQNNEPTKKVVGHVLEVIKTDLGLTLWKLTENSTDANRIGTLEQYLKEKYELYSTATFSSKTKNIIRKSLHEIRNNALAHNSLVKGNASISVESSTMYNDCETAKSSIHYVIYRWMLALSLLMMWNYTP